MEMTSGRKGAVAEAAIAAEATRLGFDVYRPIADGGRYDLIIDVGERLVRTQCKWAAVRSGVIVVYTRTSRLTPRGYVRTTYDASEIDGVAAYCDALGRSFWLPIGECAGHAVVHLRIEPARNGQRQGLKWAAQYPLGAIAQLGERRAGSAKVVGSSPTSST
jgi:hypothetical protein